MLSAAEQVDASASRRRRGRGWRASSALATRTPSSALIRRAPGRGAREGARRRVAPERSELGRDALRHLRPPGIAQGGDRVAGRLAMERFCQRARRAVRAVREGHRSRRRYASCRAWPSSRSVPGNGVDAERIDVSPPARHRAARRAASPRCASRRPASSTSRAVARALAAMCASARAEVGSATGSTRPPRACRRVVVGTDRW